MRNESACLKNPHSKSTDYEYQLCAVGGNEQLIYQTKKKNALQNGLIWYCLTYYKKNSDKNVSL